MHTLPVEFTGHPLYVLAASTGMVAERAGGTMTSQLVRHLGNTPGTDGC